jgi:hypothetical protein
MERIMKTQYITRLMFFIALTLVIELVGLPQPFTGPLVNAMLILTTLVLQPAAGVILGVLTPTVALLRGQLPPGLLPMVPFIMTANALLVLSFAVIRNLLKPFFHAKPILFSVNAWLALAGAAFLKFVWLYFSAKLVLPLLLGSMLPKPFIVMMALPQFLTALAGGALALVIYTLLQQRYFSSSK